MLFKIILICLVVFESRFSSAARIVSNSFAIMQAEQIGREYNDCVETSISKVENRGEVEDLICFIYTKTGMQKCTENFVNDLKGYLHRDERYLPDFLLNGLKDSSSKACDPEKKQKLNETATLFFMDYFDHPDKFNVFDSGIDQCFKDNNLFLYKSIYVPYTKAHICSDTQTVSHCVLKLISKNTKNNYSELIDLVFGSYLDWCRTHKNSASALSISQIGITFPLIVLASYLYETYDNCLAKTI